MLQLHNEYLSVLDWEVYPLGTIIDLIVEHELGNDNLFGGREQILNSLLESSEIFEHKVKLAGFVPIRSELELDYDIMHELEVSLAHMNCLKIGAMFIQHNNIYQVVYEQENDDYLIATNVVTNEPIEFLKDTWVPLVKDRNYIKSLLSHDLN